MSQAHGERPAWTPQRPRFRPGQTLLSWLLASVSLFVAMKLVLGTDEIMLMRVFGTAAFLR